MFLRFDLKPVLARGERVTAGRIYTIATAAMGEEISGVVGLCRVGHFCLMYPGYRIIASLTNGVAICLWDILIGLLKCEMEEILVIVCFHFWLWHAGRGGQDD